MKCPDSHPEIELEELDQSTIDAIAFRYSKTIDQKVYRCPISNKTWFQDALKSYRA